MVKDKNILIVEVAIAWCLAWGDDLEPQVSRETLHHMREAMLSESPVPEAVRAYVEQAQTLEQLTYPETQEQLQALAKAHSQLWDATIGLVYGGATKIKQYVFEASKLQDIRGASALLDRINLVDLPAFFHGDMSERFQQCQRFATDCQRVRTDWLDQGHNFPGLSQALIPELVIYSTGGNILAFCPAAHGPQLANAIEKRYTEETLSANSCAVSQTFRGLELRLGLLKEPIEETPWLEWYRQHACHELATAYYGEPEDDLSEQFKRRKSFNELVAKLTHRFNQRRSGYDQPGEMRPSRRYPAMFETHPYIRRDNTDKRSAVFQAEALPNSPWLSEITARKRLVGQRAKREDQSNAWFSQAGFDWQPGKVDSWVQRFEEFLDQNSELHDQYNRDRTDLQEARSLREIANASHGFVAYIYTDGNNMGGYIQTITTAQAYQHFSEVVSKATEQSVYRALAKHLRPHCLRDIDDAETKGRNGQWIHPFEILTIGGDDVMLVVPANQALAIAQTISTDFEQLLLTLDPSLEIARPPSPSQAIHRYRHEQANPSRCCLSMSTGVLITAENTPIYYAERLANQLLKSAKKKAKQLKREQGYCGGTVDVLVMKAVTMLSSKISEFRESGLVLGQRPKLKLYAAPYTLHEIGGLIATVQALKQAEFPRSQLYQIRSLLERGKHTAILNYRYFRVRLAKDKQTLLQNDFEAAWCQPKNQQNGGNLAPWMSLKEKNGTTTYETIWRDLIDLYPFIDVQPSSTMTPDAKAEVR